MREKKTVKSKPKKKATKKIMAVVPAQEPAFVPRSGIDLIGILMIVAVVTLMSLAFLGVF